MHAGFPSCSGITLPELGPLQAALFGPGCLARFLTLRVFCVALVPCPFPGGLCPWAASHAACSGPLSTVEDLERNNGSSERPYFMSSTLKKLLNKTNKKPVES